MISIGVHYTMHFKYLNQCTIVYMEYFVCVCVYFCLVYVNLEVFQVVPTLRPTVDTRTQ